MKKTKKLLSQITMRDCYAHNAYFLWKGRFTHFTDFWGSFDNDETWGDPTIMAYVALLFYLPVKYVILAACYLIGCLFAAIFYPLAWFWLLIHTPFSYIKIKRYLRLKCDKEISIMVFGKP